MVTRKALFGVLLMLVTREARAEPANAARDHEVGEVSIAPASPATASRPLPDEPALHHVPLTVAAPHQALAVAATIDRPDLVKRAVLAYQHGGHVDVVSFERSALADKPYVAVIPAAHVDRPSIAYAIELERTDGSSVPVFASRDQMQPVQVAGDRTDVEEEALLARLGGRRFVVETSGEYAYFGSSTLPVSPNTIEHVPDQFWHAEGGFTYRVLRTVSEFGIRGGMYRGTSALPGASNTNVGLNYGAPWVRLRATGWLHLEAEILSSVTEVGFSLGGGAAVLLGDAYGSHLTLGFEAIDVFGTRGYSRFDLMVTRRLRLSPNVEVTTMPHAPSAGVRLLADLGLSLGQGWLVTLRGGYQARAFDGGGPAAGGGLSYAF